MFKLKLLPLSLLTIFISMFLTSYNMMENQSNYLDESIQRGEGIFMTNCMHCHMKDGKGAEPLVPPLHNSPRIMHSKSKAIRQVLHGLDNPITINGIEYNASSMPSQSELSDQEIADVLNYIRNSWGNKTNTAVKAADVAQER